MARNLDLAALRSFIAVAENGGVTAAAQRLHLTQSGVSMQLKRLEENLGVALLAREGRGVTLTNRGEELLSAARRLVTLNDEVWSQITTPPLQGDVILGLPHDVMHPLAPVVLKRFSDDYPGIETRLISASSKNLLAMMAKGEVDVILTTEFERGVSGETLAKVPLVWMGAQGGRAWRQRPLPLVSMVGCMFRPFVCQALDKASIPWVWRVNATHSSAYSACIAADLGVDAWMAHSIPQNLTEIEQDDILPELPVTYVNLYVSQAKSNHAALELAEYVKKTIRDVYPMNLLLN